MTGRSEFSKLVFDKALTIMPGAYDGLSAKIIETLGFPAITAGGYAANGSMYAEPDIGQSNMREFADHYARICGSVRIPVTVDADTGFGGVHNVRRMVRAFEDAGVASLTFSDQTFPNRCGYMAGKGVIEVNEMVAKIRAALDARRDATMLIAARTDCASILGVEAAIERANIFLEAGADLAKPMGVHNREDVRKIMQEVPSPYFAVMSQAAGAHSITFDDLRDDGVSVVILPSIALFAAAEGVRSALLRVKADGSLRGVQKDLIPLADYYALVDLDGASEREDRYRQEADKILERQSRLLDLL